MSSNQNPYTTNHRVKEKKIDQWVRQPTASYNQGQEKEKEEAVSITAYLPKSAYEEVMRDVLPSLFGTKVGKNGQARKVTMTDYLRDVVLADLASRREDKR